MNESTGYIYKIINDINDKVYIGETTRNLDVRFSEHCFDNRSTSQIHKAIKENGWQHFKIIEIERPPISKLYEREKYWVEYYNSYYNGYNGTLTGQSIKSFENTRFYNSIYVKEPNLYFDSAESMAREISEITSWSFSFCNDKIKESIKQNKKFLDYTLKSIKIPLDQISSVDDRENWIKNLNIQYSGKHIYSKELNKEFNTTGESAKYIYDNKLYSGNSKTPIQSLITSINKNLKKEIEYITTTKGNITFELLPGSTKNKGSENPYQKVRIHCNELNLNFESQKEAAEYMLNNKYWTGIKLKTAKLRISDIINDIFPNYKGYSFKKID